MLYFSDMDFSLNRYGIFGSHGETLGELFKTAEFSGAEIFEGPEIKGHNRVIDVYYDYWSSKCQKGQLPGRRDIHPEQLRGCLPYAVLLDILDEPGAYQDFRLIVRLFGTHVAEAFGEVTGKDVAEIPNPGSAKRIYYMTALVREKRVAFMTRIRGYAPGRDHMEAFILYTPLSETGKTVDKIFGGVEVRVLKEDG